VIVAARNEADRIAATLAALRQAIPRARLVVADDGSTDETSTIASNLGAELSSRSGGPKRRRGKGGAVTAAARHALDTSRGTGQTFLLCDGDLGSSAARLALLIETVESGECDLAVASFARREGGGFGVALGFARWSVRSLTGLELRAPISGQRAIKGELLGALLPFAVGYGMEVGMTVDAARAGYRLKEVDLDLEHRATGRNVAGFLHRGRQLLAFAAVYARRRLARGDRVRAG
jgi:glycosyltransferase involved in cell wall biosynthesis